MSYDAGGKCRERLAAEWCCAHVVNREDAYGSYSGGKALTAKGAVTLGLIERHFGGEVTIGLQAIAPDGTCRWGCIDIDAHDGKKDRAESIAKEVCNKLVVAGVQPVLEDSGGGFHVWIFFDVPVPAVRVRRFLRRFVASKTEVFPKQDQVEPGGFGSWVRLPGRHPKHGTWSRFWDPTGQRWVEWPDGLDLFVAAPRCSVAVLPIDAGSHGKEIEATRGSGAERRGVDAGTTTFESDVPMTEREDRCRKYLAKCPDALSGQGGHDKTYRAACECFRFGLDDAAAARVMESFNATKCDEKWSVEELAHKIRDAKEEVIRKGEIGLRVRQQAGTRPAATAAPANEPSDDVRDGPHGIRLVIREVRKAVKGQRITAHFSLHIDGRETGICISTTDSGTGARRAIAELLAILRDERPNWPEEVRREIRSWARRVFSATELASIYAEQQRRLAELRSRNPDDRKLMRDIAREESRRELDLRFVTGGRAWSERLGRLISREDFIRHTPGPLVDAIRRAADARTTEDDVQAVVTAERLLRIAWPDIFATLPPETGETGLGVDSKRARQFAVALGDLMNAPELYVEHGSRREADVRRLRMSISQRVRDVVRDVRDRPATWRRILPGIDVFIWAGTTEGTDVDAQLAIREGLVRGQVPRHLIESVRSFRDLKILVGRYALAASPKDRVPHSWADPETGKTAEMVVLSAAFTSRILFGDGGGTGQ